MTTDERWEVIEEALEDSVIPEALQALASLRTDHELLIQALERIDALPFSDKVYGIHDIARTALDRIATKREEEG